MAHIKTTRLTANEEVTLRRVAYGQSIVATLRAADLNRLRDLKLIDGAWQSPTLTLEGRRRFQALPKPSMVTTPKRHDELMASLAEVTGRIPPRRQ